MDYDYPLLWLAKACLGKLAQCEKVESTKKLLVAARIFTIKLLINLCELARKFFFTKTLILKV
jgi:hypothetical protein